MLLAASSWGLSILQFEIWAFQSRSLGKLYWTCGRPAWTWDIDAAGKARGTRVPGVQQDAALSPHPPRSAQPPKPTLAKPVDFELFLKPILCITARASLPAAPDGPGAKPAHPQGGSNCGWAGGGTACPLCRLRLCLNASPDTTAICSSCEISLSWNSSPLPLMLTPTQCIYREQSQSRSARPRLFKPCYVTIIYALTACI